MSILVTGLPRHRSSLIVHHLQQKLNLDCPDNVWGEANKKGEQISNWINRPNSVFKLWGISVDNFEQVLLDFKGQIIVTYSNDLDLFIAKLLRAHVLSDYSPEQRVIAPISFVDNLERLQEINWHIQMFRKSLDLIMLNPEIMLKCIFVNSNKAFAHIQAKVNPETLAILNTFAQTWKPSVISSYIKSEELNLYHEHIHKTFGRTICS